MKSRAYDFMVGTLLEIIELKAYIWQPNTAADAVLQTHFYRLEETSKYSFTHNRKNLKNTTSSSQVQFIIFMVTGKPWLPVFIKGTDVKQIGEISKQ